MIEPSSPPPTVVFRAMTAADIAEALALWAATDGVEVSEGDSPEELRRYLELNPGLSQVATRADRLVGALLAGHDGRRGYLYHLSVDRGHRGGGIGRELAARSLQALRSQGLKRALILVVRGNAIGTSFWLRQGWECLETADAMGIDL